MKYLKRFNESILNDVRSKVNDSRDKISQLGSQKVKFCGECGNKINMSDIFCDECGAKQDESAKTFTINGKIEAQYPNGQKTPNFVLSSDNKTLSGTPIQLDSIINKNDIPIGEEVSITGTTKNSESPKFNNPIFVSKKEDIKLK